jgi:mono/diheme cytochrome c family protein
MMYAGNEAEVREWILDGITASRRNDPDDQAEVAKMLVHMPAFRDWLSTAQLENLVAFVKAVSWLNTPKDERSTHGREVASSKGCFSCHGPEGLGCMLNPGSFKGYIPAWDSPDFPDVAANEQEVREWILDGVCKRIAKHPVGGFFVRQQRVPMPAFRGNISDEEINGIVAYINWLRRAK